MAYDLEEQEQLDELKEWWRQYGNFVLLVVAAAALSFAAIQGWRYYRHSQAVAAVTLYSQLDRAERSGDRKKVRELAGELAQKYGATPYAVFGALSAARASFDTGDLAGAKSQLQWVIEHAREDEIKDLARLRLAGVLLDEKNTAEALTRVEWKPADAMAGLYADLKGDILVAQGKTAEARSAYQLALDRSEANSPYRATIQIKLDALGDAK